LGSVAREMAGVQTAVIRARGARPTAEQRLSNGELLYRMNDYDRAVVVLSEIIEEFPDTPSYPDALWLRGETYYASHDYLAARRDYRLLVERGNEPRFQAYLGRALARLVDVSLRVNDPPQSLASVLERFNQVPAAQVDASLLYAKGKAYFRQGAWNAAGDAFRQVPSTSPFGHQARYFQGLIAMKMARGSPSDGAKKGAIFAGYKQAIDAFRVATELPPDSVDHRHVIDLSWMAIGRLLYEMEQYQQASEAYSKVGRDSAEFDTMLYELAWVYVRLGDVQRAERALEVLTVSDPNSPYISDGTLLRADLLLRAGAFDRALRLYESVREQYDPMRAKVDSFLDSTADPSLYYDRLAQQDLDVVEPNQGLPALAVRWAREAEDGPLAFAVVDDVKECRALIRQSADLAEKLAALAGASNRVRAFPEVEAGEETALALLNRVSRTRLSLSRALDSLEPVELGGEIGMVREHRRALSGSMQDLPAGPEDFSKRQQRGMAQWNTLSQELTRRSGEVDALNASINGLRRMLSEGPQQGVARDPVSLQRFQAELDANERDLRRYAAEITDLRRSLDMGRAQIGVGDARYQNDALVRDQFRDLLDREVRLAGAGVAGNGAQRFAGEVTPVLVQARQYEDQLLVALQQLESQVSARAGELQNRIVAERASIAKFGQQLDGLDGDARDLVGHVAERNFRLVSDRLRGIVLRADVGVTEQAWEVREEEQGRVRSLQSERSRQEQLLDEELKEVRDDGVEPGQPAK
ncbi:MAG: tetratricopeptide repeat protein, partial [Myxococcota bacterium]|nr:tetratricopeptide repeat protein [Myxococcota bacterium]